MKSESGQTESARLRMAGVQRERAKITEEAARGGPRGEAPLVLPYAFATCLRQ